MYGVPAQLDLTPFVGTTLDQIRFGQFQIHFTFSGEPGTADRGVSVEGYWELRDGQSALIDAAVVNDERDSYKIHRLLGRTVTAIGLNPPKSLTLFFDNGLELTIVDDSDQYECCRISTGTEETHI